MKGMRVGLRHRIERGLHQVEEQHRQLREIADQLDRVLAAGIWREIERWLTRFHEALSSHFDLEETVLFPALHGLDASLRVELEKLESDHTLLLSVLLKLGPPGGDSSAGTLIDSLASLRERLQRHEQTEERLIRQVLES